MERMTTDYLAKCLHTAAAEWMESHIEQTQEALGLEDLHGYELMKFRWELAFLCMYAIFWACDIVLEEKAETVRTAYLAHFRQALLASGMNATAIVQLIDMWKQRYAEYEGAILYDRSGGDPLFWMCSIAMKNIFGELKQDPFVTSTVLAFFGPFLEWITEFLKKVEVRG